MTGTLHERLHTERRCRAARHASPDSLALLEQAARAAYEREHLRDLARQIRDTKRGKELHKLLSDLVQYALGEGA